MFELNVFRVPFLVSMDLFYRNERGKENSVVEKLNAAISCDYRASYY